MPRKHRKILFWFILSYVLLLLVFLRYFKYVVTIKPPVTGSLEALKYQRVQVDSNFYVCNNCWLRKSNSGLWEMYLEGKPFERGVINGLLTKELNYQQESAFVNEIKKMIPSTSYLKFLRYFIAWFDRNLDKYVKNEYQLEIYGISKSASDEFSYIGPAYQRMMGYHAAHDIGHALQNMHMVGCTSFAAWGSATEDSSMIIGRNFDFNVGDEFAKNKIVCFCNPDMGYKFMFVTWGGMIGVVSGMNEKGLTVTINADKSEIPFSATTPILLLVREILQYSKNINEAFEIAKKNKTFVSESILVGSAEDKKAALIEKSTRKIDLVFSKGDYLVCSNHFQGDTFKLDKLNIENIKRSSSQYRYNRVEELLKKYPKINYKIAAEILRDRKGMYDKDIGMGNEKAINQLIAHHSIIFNPEKLLVWVSAGPFQLGQYVCYDLKKIFGTCAGMKKDNEISEQELTIPPDTFMYSEEFKNYSIYKKLRNEINQDIKSRNISSINETLLNKLISSNPEFYYVYELAGDYYKSKKDYKNAIKFYNLALRKEIPTADDCDKIMKALKISYEN